MDLVFIFDDIVICGLTTVSGMIILLVLVDELDVDVVVPTYVEKH